MEFYSVQGRTTRTLLGPGRARGVSLMQGCVRVQGQFGSSGKWVDNLSGSLLLVQQLILKLCWKQLDLIVLGLCRCTVSTDPCAERASVLMADVLVIAMVETSRQIFGVFYRTKS